ncbi:MAG: FAD-dependent oxidoreductase [Polyangia bacterium]
MTLRVAVVGGGIAGVGAAWSASRHGHSVDLFEARDDLGGNARVHEWTHGERTLTAGLAVLAWPRAYFRSYVRLLETLGIATEPVRLRFFIHKQGATYAHDRGGALYERHRADFDRWRTLVQRIRTFNARVSPGPASLYRVSYWNPATYIPGWQLARLSGISRAFWDDIVVALYSSSFLTSKLDALPAFVLPTIDDLISVDSGGTMDTWTGHSGEVFEKMLASLTGTLHRDRAVTRIEPGTIITLTDSRGERHTYDRVILAADAARMAAALPTSAVAKLLRAITYVEATDRSFVEGVAHADASVLPAAHRDTILADYCTAIDVTERGYRNHFVVSSWAPVARGTGATMLVSYNEPTVPTGSTFRFSNQGAHPDLSLRNLLTARRLAARQGEGGLYFCGSYMTPGNGHDLSLLSGLVAASALGAPFPFAGDPDANADYLRLRGMLLRTQ